MVKLWAFSGLLFAVSLAINYWLWHENKILKITLEQMRQENARLQNEVVQCRQYQHDLVKSHQAISQAYQQLQNRLAKLKQQTIIVKEGSSREETCYNLINALDQFKRLQLHNQDELPNQD